MRSGTTFWRALVLAMLVPMASPAQQPQIGQAHERFDRLPLIFEGNQGQSGPQVRFLSHAPGYTAFLTGNGMVLSLRPREERVDQQTNTLAVTANPRSHARSIVEFRLLGANNSPISVGEDPQPGKVNYFFGRNPAKWHTNIPTYAKVRYKNIYPGIDLAYHGSHQQLEYDFEMLPGADPGRIRFAIRGADHVQMDSQGNLVLQIGSAELRFQSPVIYQITNGRRMAVDGRYVVDDSGQIGFRVGKHDSQSSLVIDPTLQYSTYLGGSGDDQPSGIAVDGTGSVYITGYTDSTDFPLATLGSLPTGTDHVFLAKLDSSGSSLVYADYIGGSSADYGYALALDGSNDAWITGSTQSSDFPVVHPYQASQPGRFSGFVTEISADGSSILYSTYLGGNNIDQPLGISLDGSGYVYVAGVTSSTNFPVANAYQPTMSPNQGGQYGASGFVTKLSPDGSSLVYSTFLGGNSNVVETCGGNPCWFPPANIIYGIAIDASGDAYVAGNTNTYNFPVTAGAYLTTDSAPNNTLVGFVSKLTSSGNLGYSTYFYESSGASTQIAAIAVDNSGSAYITGSAPSDGTFPITSTSICDPSVSFGECSYAFVTKFDPTGSFLVYSTFLAANNNAFPQSIVVDGNHDAYISCSTNSGYLVTVNGIESYSGGYDLLLAEIDPNATTELFASFLGGAGDEYPYGLALDAGGNLYVGGQTSSTDFPITQGAFQATNAGNTNAFVLKIEAQSAPAFSASSFSLSYPTLAVGQTSPPQTVLVRDMGSAPLVISSITATGAFAETDNCGSTVPAAGSCTLAVTFTPSVPGSQTGSILIQDNAAGSPHIINLAGDGSGPFASFNPGSLTFPNSPVGTSSPAQTLGLANTGNTALNISSVQITGDYSETNNCPVALSSGASCQFQIVFSPSAVGTRNGTLTLADDAANSPQSVPLTGIGYVTSVAVAPGNLVFGNQSLHLSSTPQVVTLTNTGTSSVTVSSINTSGDFSQTNNCGTVAASGTCTINVTFTPTAVGARNGTLTINDNAQGSPQTVNLAGTGIVPGFSVSPTSLSFGTESLNLTSPAQTLAVTNTGNGPLTITSVQAGGDFSQSNNCATVPANGGTCTVSVTFTPTMTGARPGTITFTDSALNSPQTVPLTGTGLSSGMSALPGSLIFAAQAVGTTSVPQQITLTNVGGATLTLNGISIAGTFAQTNTCPSSLAAEASCTISVTFKPNASGKAVGSVTISNSSSQSPLVVALSGSGTDFDLTSGQSSDTVQAGSTATYLLSVAPVGGAFPNPIKLSCVGAPEQTTCNLSQSTVVPGSNPASVTLKIDTTASVANALRLPAPRSVDGMWISLQGIGLFGLILACSRRRIRGLGAQILFPIGIAALLFMSACAGGTGIAQQPGTTPGTYMITVKGTSGTLEHSLSLTLKVD